MSNPYEIYDRLEAEIRLFLLTGNKVYYEEISQIVEDYAQKGQLIIYYLRGTIKQINRGLNLVEEEGNEIKRILAKIQDWFVIEDDKNYEVFRDISLEELVKRESELLALVDAIGEER